MSDSVQPHRWQPTRLPPPWDSPVFWSVQCPLDSPVFSRQEHWSGLPFPSPMHESEKWKWSRSVVPDSVRKWSLSVVSKTLPPPWTLTRQAPLSLGILQARILEWVAMPSFRGSSQPRDGTQVSHIAGRFFYNLSHQGRPRNCHTVLCISCTNLHSPPEV